MNVRDKAKVMTETCKMLNLPTDEQMAKLPEIIGTLIQQPVMVSFCFNPVTGLLLQVAVSNLEPSALVYSQLAQVTRGVAEQYQDLSIQMMEAENGKRKGTDPDNEDD